MRTEVRLWGSVTLGRVAGVHSLTTRTARVRTMYF